MGTRGQGMVPERKMWSPVVVSHDTRNCTQEHVLTPRVLCEKMGHKHLMPGLLVA